MVIRDSERVEVLKAPESETLLNLSTGGAAFLYTQALPENREVVLKVNDVAVRGQVIHTRQRTDGYHRIGVRFSRMPPDIQTAIRNMVDSFSCGVPLHFTVEHVGVLKSNVYE